MRRQIVENGCWYGLCDEVLAGATFLVYLFSDVGGRVSAFLDHLLALHHDVFALIPITTKLASATFKAELTLSAIKIVLVANRIFIFRALQGRELTRPIGEAPIRI